MLAVPKLAVSEMRGKNAARAAPMLALAAISCCSAARMSGRRLEQFRRQAGRHVDRHLPCIERQRRRQVGRHRLADQQRQRVLVERALAQLSAASAARAPSSSDSAWRKSSSDDRAVVEAQLGEAESIPRASPASAA